MKARTLVMMIVVGWFIFNQSLPTPAAGLESSRLLQGLIDGARQEGQLNLRTVRINEKGLTELTNAFKQRFNLDIKMNIDHSGQESVHFNKAITEAKTGLPPSFDLLQGDQINIFFLKEAGGAERVENWEPLLAEIAPEAYSVRHKVTPSVIAGYGFVWGARIYALVYNPRLISAHELPRTHKDVGHSKYNGAFAVPPFTTQTQLGILKYNNDEWLDIVRSWGRLKANVLMPGAGLQRMMLGEFKFMETSNPNYYQEKAKDPNAPIEMTFFEDFTPMLLPSYVIQKGARNPNAATLFMLWATSTEANRIFEKYTFHENIYLGTGLVSRKTLNMLEDKNIQPVSWFDSSRSLEKFRWLASEEGRLYAQALGTAQREGR